MLHVAQVDVGRGEETGSYEVMNSTSATIASGSKSRLAPKKS